MDALSCASASSTEISRDSPVLQAAIALPNPYVDPLSPLQIALLKQKEGPRIGGVTRERKDR